MKKKIQDALKTAYENKLGFKNEKVYERVASLGETYVTNEEDIPAFVAKAEDILKGFQGVEDKGRSLQAANAKITELEKQIENFKKRAKGEPEPEPPLEEPIDVAKLISEAISNAIKPISDSLDALKTQASAEKARNQARSSFFNGDYAKKYKDEAEDAWDRAIELNEATGNKMSAEELTTKATAYFNKYVTRKGIDITQPLSSDGMVDEKPDFKEDVEILQKDGLLPTDK